MNPARRHYVAFGFMEVIPAEKDGERGREEEYPTINEAHRFLWSPHSLTNTNKSHVAFNPFVESFFSIPSRVASYTYHTSQVRFVR